MPQRKKRGRTDPAAGSTRRERPPPLAPSPVDPPRPNRLAVAVSAALFVVWFGFLVYLVVISR